MEKSFYFKNAGFPPIKFCKNDDKQSNDGTKERFFQNNKIHNINIRQLLTETNKKLIIIPNDEEPLEIVNTINRD